jgi:mannose/fructose-specific phosphotransferase system component IIA
MIVYILIRPEKTKESSYDSVDTYYGSKVSYKYKDKWMQKQNKNVIILTGMNTGSVADKFVSDMKKNNMVTVIGNTINYHIKKFFSDSELQEDSVIRKFRITAGDGKSYNTIHYNQELCRCTWIMLNCRQSAKFP